MPAKRKQKKTKSIPVKSIGILSDSVRSYENDPFFIKKAEKAKTFLKKAGIPEDLKKRGVTLY